MTPPDDTACKRDGAAGIRESPRLHAAKPGEDRVDSGKGVEYRARDECRDKASSGDCTLQRDAERGARDFESAAAFIEASKRAGEEASGVRQEVDGLVEWARREGKIVSDPEFERLELVSNSTSEHEVRHNDDANRAVKRTWSGFYGQIPTPENGKLGRRNAIPSEYLRRMALQNRVFDTDNQLVGVNVSKRPSMIIGQSAGEPSIVISQQWVASDESAPDDQEISRLLEREGFKAIPGSYYGWYRPGDGVTIIDAKPDNFVKVDRIVRPIDLQMKQFTPEEMTEAGLSWSPNRDRE